MTNTVNYLILDSKRGNKVVGKAEELMGEDGAIAVRDDLLRRTPYDRYRYIIRPKRHQ